MKVIIIKKTRIVLDKITCYWIENEKLLCLQMVGNSDDEYMRFNLGKDEAELSLQALDRAFGIEKK